MRISGPKDPASVARGSEKLSTGKATKPFDLTPLYFRSSYFRKGEEFRLRKTIMRFVIFYRSLIP